MNVSSVERTENVILVTIDKTNGKIRVLIYGRSESNMATGEGEGEGGELGLNSSLLQ